MADASAVATLAPFTEPGTPDFAGLVPGPRFLGRGVGSAGVDPSNEPAKPREGQRCHAIAPPAQRGPDQAMGLRVPTAPPAFPQVGPDLPGGGCVELAVDTGVDLRTQSSMPQMTHAWETHRPPLVIPAPERTN